MSEFLTFRKMITPFFIQLLFWLGVLAVIASGIFLMTAGDQLALGLMTVILGPLVVRIYAELLIVIFRIQSSLNELVKLNRGGGAAAAAPAAPAPAQPAAGASAWQQSGAYDQGNYAQQPSYQQPAQQPTQPQQSYQQPTSSYPASSGAQDPGGYQQPTQPQQGYSQPGTTPSDPSTSGYDRPADPAPNDQSETQRLPQDPPSEPPSGGPPPSGPPSGGPPPSN